MKRKVPQPFLFLCVSTPGSEVSVGNRVRGLGARGEECFCKWADTCVAELLLEQGFSNCASVASPRESQRELLHQKVFDPFHCLSWVVCSLTREYLSFVPSVGNTARFVCLIMDYMYMYVQIPGHL